MRLNHTLALLSVFTLSNSEAVLCLGENLDKTFNVYIDKACLKAVASAKKSNKPQIANGVDILIDGKAKLIYATFYFKEEKYNFKSFKNDGVKWSINLYELQGTAGSLVAFKAFLVDYVYKSGDSRVKELNSFPLGIVLDDSNGSQVIIQLTDGGTMYGESYLKSGEKFDRIGVFNNYYMLTLDKSLNVDLQGNKSITSAAKAAKILNVKPN